MFSSREYPDVVPPLPPQPAQVQVIANGASSRDGDASRSKPSGRGVAVPLSRQPFPIRISQAAHQRAMSMSSSNAFASVGGQEYQLRRKTPSGTIDAGYDGSPTQLCPGPPPLKQMMLPTPSVANLFPRPGAHQFPAIDYHGHPSRFENEETVDANAAAPSPSSWLSAQGIAGLDASTRQGMLLPNDRLGSMWQPGNYPLQGQTANFYQPLMRAYEYNVRAFCPPPVPVADSPSFGQFGWQSGPVMWEPQYLERFGGLPSNNAPSSGIGGSPQYGSQQESKQPQPQRGTGHSMLARDVTQSSNFDLQGLRLDVEPGNGCSLSGIHAHAQRTFREKALLHAHRNYVDLLSYVQSLGRVNQPDSNRDTRDTRDTRPDVSSKPIVYPKAPKLQPDGPNFAVQGSPSGFHGEEDSQSLLAKRKGRAGHSLFAAATAYLPQLPSRAFGGVSHVHGMLVDGSSAGGRPSATVNARNSLEVLRNLCEQSGWQWTEGILLGGCLQYGLGRYEDALKWFSRVVTLDSSHVEAITNMAATLYCLGRQDEAEQHWLRAVRLCPGHLDAVEHLVGLLYRKRNHDAIKIIGYVQQALRLADNNGQYAVPGHENGRMLALVHAKGTMLYALKDISRASKAFEEAVLISVGQRVKSVQDLVRQIHAVLSLEACLQAPRNSGEGAGASAPLRPLMLPPEKARKTAHLLFARHGELPGLSLVSDGSAKRIAIQTTSNALLSLAKIYQDAMSSGNTDVGLTQQQSCGVGDILALYYLSLSLQESPSTANNVGILLAGVQQSVVGTVNAPQSPSPSQAQAQAQAMQQPLLPGVPSGSGLALALAYYNYGLRLDPKHVHLYTNLGSLLKDIGQLDLAIQMYERAVSCDGTFDIALTNLANAVKDKGRVKDAIAYYKRAVVANPAFSEAVCGLFTALNSVCDWRGRGGVLLDFGKFDRWHVDENGALQDVRASMRGSGLSKRVVSIVRQQLGEASRWGCNLLRQPNVRKLVPLIQRLCSESADDASNKNMFDEALGAWTGNAWEGARLVRLLERATKVMQWKWFCDLYLHGKELTAELTAEQYPRLRLPSSLSIPSAPTVLPFHTFTCPLPARDIRKISQSNAIRISCSTLRSSWLSHTVYPPPPPPNPHLNIGYVSSDFNNHPLAHLMQSVFGFHDPRRARAFCYATTPSDRSTHRLKIENEAPTFRDVSTWPPSKFLDQIVADQIHILVNLNGYTRGARNEVFAARPAPIQMSFMGFAGTLGAEWCDYILADSTAIPPKTLRPWRNNTAIEDVFRDESEGDEPDWMYSENVIFCRHTFFCCDHAQSCGEGEREVTWEEEQRRRWSMRKELFPLLPDDAVILGNFNQLYKIEPTTFRSWLRILSRTPKAILWLLRFPDLGESNLRHTAELWAGAEVASRIIFTDVAPKNQHISRARVCDLFLDTPECNAHTTAADILWSSTPLLTLPRYPYKMCSRMAASILKGALPASPEGEQAARHLIANSETEYEESAADLANELHYSTGRGFGEGRGLLAEFRKLLFESKWDCALFNTRRWVEDVQEAYEEAWRRWVRGEGGDIYL